jgi:predicted ATPase
MSLGIDALLLSIIGDDVGLEQRADGLVAFATDQGFPFYRATGAIFRGWVKAKNADVTEGLSLLRAGSSAYCATGATAWMSLYIALLAGACEIAGQIEEGAARLDQALQLVERTGERWFAAELDRHKGHARSQRGKGTARRVGIGELCAVDAFYRASVPRRTMPDNKSQFCADREANRICGVSPAARAALGRACNLYRDAYHCRLYCEINMLIC